MDELAFYYGEDKESFVLQSYFFFRSKVWGCLKLHTF